MSNQIVVLNASTSADGSFSVSGVFWLVAPANNVVPRPQFSSQVPFVDQATLNALRAGTLVEQSFSTGFYPPGTSLATIQAALQVQYTAAQAAVTSAASPLAGLVATEYTGSGWVSTASGLVVFDPLTRLVTDMDWAAAAGLIPGASVGKATGYCQTSAASNKAVLGTAYTPQGNNAQRSLVSSSANDAAAGTGAQQVTVAYLDTAFSVHTEVVTMNGTTPVNTIGADIAYIEGMTNTRVGSGGTNAGIISIMTATAGGGSAWGSITIDGSNTTMWCHHYVPAGVTCYVRAFDGGAFGTVGSLFLQALGNPSVGNVPGVQIGSTIIHPAAGWSQVAIGGIAVPGPNRIVLFTRPQAATADSTVGNFRYIQF